MKIAVCVNHYAPSIGGAELVAQNIVEYLAKYHELYVFTRKLQGKNRDARVYPEYRVIEYRQGDVVGFEKKLKSIAPDVVLIYSDVFDFFRNIAARQNPFKLIIALCGANWLCSHRNYQNILYRNLPRIHALVCHSKYERDYRICSVDRAIQKTVIIPNGVWTDEFDSNTLTRQDLAPDIADKRWILNVSNFFPGKGQEHLVSIIRNLPEPEKIAYIQVYSDIDFEVGEVLESKWRVSTLSLAKDLGVTVKRVKNADRERVIGFFRQSNVFAFTSEKEVAPLVLLESMAASLPWVATNVGNAKELRGGSCIPSIKDSRFHSAFRGQTKDIFAQKIQEMWNSPSVGEEGRKQIDEELHWDKILPQYLELVEG